MHRKVEATIMSLTTNLAVGIKEAIRHTGDVRVAVHSQEQAELGRRAAERLSAERAPHITFEVIPDGEQEDYPIGAILV